MEYSKENIMTRKEYLKSKKKKNFLFSKLKYILLLIVVVLLGVYVFKQLNLYNNVTKIANKVVEEAKLARTMTMYYVSEPYTKDGDTVVTLYKASDESRNIIAGTESMKNITIVDNILYGIVNEQLYQIDLLTGEKQEVIEKETKIQDYIVKDANIYLKKKDGIYKYDKNAKKTVKIIDAKITTFFIDSNNVFAIAEGKTSKSVIKYNLKGKKEKELSEKYMVSNIYMYEDNIYFTNSKDSKLYSVPKSGGDIKKVIDKKVQAGNSIVFYKDYMYYINKDDSNTLYAFNLKTAEDKQIVKKSISSLQLQGIFIYYNLTNAIGIYKHDVETGQDTQVTSARTSEFVCLN